MLAGILRDVRLTTGFVLWVVAAAAATAVGLAAVAAIGTDIFGAGSDPLSQSEVDELLASRTQPPPTSTSSSAPSSPVTTTTPTPPAERPTVTEGGTVIARCTTAGLVEILSASPAQGYQVEREDGVEDHPEVKFTSGDRKVEIRLRCVNGIPDPEIKLDD
jgi:hypothetical protein